MGPLALFWLLGAAGCWGRQYERAAVREAAEYGLQRMNDLVSVQEPRLYQMGMWLGTDDPARYVAAFNGQGEQARRLARFGYAALQASTKLMQRVYEGRGGQPPRFPAISPLNTPLYERCPLREPPACPHGASRYRTHEGACNNPAHPWWGAALMPLGRFLPPHYRDGLERIRDSVSGGVLPSARAVSSAIHGDRDVELGSVSHMVMQWGQFLDHDLTATAQSRGFNGSVPKCCSNGGRGFQPPDLTHPDCLAIPVPASDDFYSHYGVRCLEFVRSSPASRAGCTLGPRDQINQVTSFIDASVVYGSDASLADQLRLHRGGLLKYSRVQYRLPLLPTSPRGSELCRGASGRVRCFWSGDGRVNEQPGLAAMHTLFLRAHNRLATELSHLNPRWGDEKLYQEARRILAAVLQHVTFGEFLPIVLGEDVMKMFGLQLQRKGYYDGYDITVDPGVANEFAAAAFRFGHSLVQRSLVRGDRNHQQLHSNVSLHEELTNPGNLYNIGSVDRLLLGLCMQPSQKRDEFITEQLTNHLFQTPSFRYGTDLAAINIQRGRDHGLAPYNAWREACGLPQFHDWGHLLKVMSPATLRRLQDVYRDVDDIDLFPGGMSERPVAGGLVGPTFACIIAQQFRNLRRGDRFWYENAGFESSFTPAQLQQLRKITMARILCDNLDTIDTIQPFVFLMSDRDRNPYVSCDDRLIPQFDLQPWTEYHKEQGHPGAPGYPSAKPDNEAGELPSYPSRPGDQQQQQESPEFLLDHDKLGPGHHHTTESAEPSYLVGDEFPQSGPPNNRYTTEGVKPSYLIDGEFQQSKPPNHHYTTQDTRPSYLIDGEFQQSKPPGHHYTTQGTRPSYLIDGEFQQSKPPNHHYTTQGTRPSYLIDGEFQQSKPPGHHYTTQGTRPSYLIDGEFQQSKPPNHHYTTQDTRPSYLIDGEFQQSKPPGHHYTTQGTRPSYLIDSEYQQSKPQNHHYTTEDTNPPYSTDDGFQHHHEPHDSHATEAPRPNSRPSIIIIEDFVKPAGPMISKPAVQVITARPHNPSQRPHSPGPHGPHGHKGDSHDHLPDVDPPIYVIVPGKQPGHEVPIQGHSRPHKHQSTRPPANAHVRPSHFYEEYILDEPNETRTSTQRPGYHYTGPHEPPSSLVHSSGYKPTSRPYSFIERYNEPSYYHHGSKKVHSTSYLKYVALWLPDENSQDTGTSTQLDEDTNTKASVENVESGDNLATIYSDDDWGFNTTDTEDDSELPEMPAMASDPQAVSEVPRPIPPTDLGECGSADDCRSLA